MGRLKYELNENRILVKELVKLHILCIRYVERNTNLICKSYRDIDRVLTKNKLVVSYAEGVSNLKENILKYCSDNQFLLESVADLEEKIIKSEIAELKFGDNRSDVELENDLNNWQLRCQFFYETSMVSIKTVAEELDMSVDTIKTACQRERLMNTKKIGKSWLVHIPECRAYWNKPLAPGEDEHLAYFDWEY